MDGLTEQLHSAPSRASFYVAISGQVEQWLAAEVKAEIVWKGGEWGDRS